MVVCLRLWLVFLFVSIDLSAQNISSNFQTLGVDEGLSQSSVYSLYQDKRGFLWIGTADGLNRYDGKQIKVFKAPWNSSYSKSFNPNYIRGKMMEDNNGNLWYQTENGFYIYNHATNKIEKKISVQSRWMDLVTIDSAQRVWMFNPNSGFSFYSISSRELKTIPYPFHPDPAKTINPSIITQQDDENFWFTINRGEGLYKFNIYTQRIEHYFESEDYVSINFAKGGHYLIGYTSILYYDSAKRTTVLLPLHLKTVDRAAITNLVEDEYHRAWIATSYDGLWLYDHNNKQLLNFKNELFNKSSLPTNWLTKAMLIDRNKNLWMGTEGGGVSKINTQPKVLHNSVTQQLQNLKTNLFVRSIYEDEKKNIWIGSYQKPVYILNPNTGKIVRHPQLEKLGIKTAVAILVDKEKNIWFAHDNTQITKTDSLGNLLAHGNFYPTYPSAVIRKLVLLSNGRILVGHSKKAFFIQEKEGKLFVGEETNIQNMTDVVETPNGEFWIGSSYGGMFVSNLQDLLHLSKNKKSDRDLLFSNLDVKDLHLDKENPNLLWVATDKGLLQFDRQTQKHHLYSETDGMNNSFVYCVMEDNGKLWGSTNGGIFCFDKKKNTFTNYTNKDGLQSNEFNSGAFHQGASGFLYFGGINGINWFYPSDVLKTGEAPSVAITELSVNQQWIGNSVVQSQKLELPYFKNDVVVHFSVFDFTNPESNKIKYQLIGFDDEPIITNEMEVRYLNLPMGNYQLVFSGSNTWGKWSKEQSFIITIRPPFWNTWWFYTVVAISVISAVVLIVWYITHERYKTKIAELEKQNALEHERRRISMEMHDDIGAHLTRITLISETAKHKTEKENSLEQIAQTSRKVVTSMSEIIWSLNPDNKTFEQLMSYLRDQLHKLLEPSGINYHISLPESGDCELSNPLKRNIILLVKESVNNAIKHSGANEIVVHGKLNGNIFEIEVRDNGKGFDIDHANEGNGLKNMKVRVEELHGKMKVCSEENNGTAIHFIIPINGYT